MGSIGACRQCAVKQYRDEADTQGMIVMACMTPAADGTRISIDDPEVVEFRASVIEWLMMNHPHDCPICDEGGECHLQDMTVMTGHAYRRYRFNKRTFENQYLGPFINHEMNRCIQCYRCVRFYRDHAGGRDLDVFGAHDALYFGRFEEGVLESEFSGNLVEVCPTGVFTDKTLKRHYTRKWDLSTAPSVCTHCSLGCNITPGERYGTLRRIRNRYNWDVNGYFICDRGRFGYEYVNGDARIRSPLARSEEGELEAVSGEEAIARLRAAVQSGAKPIGIGSARASVESNYALQKLVGEDRFFLGETEANLEGIKAAVEVLQEGDVAPASLREVREADAVLVLGEDLTNTAPMLAYAVRQSVRQAPMSIPRKLGIPDWNDAAVREAVQTEKGPLYIACHSETKLDEIARDIFRAAPVEQARLGFAVAHVIHPQAPDVPDISAQTRARAQQIARDLLEAERPVVISGISARDVDLMRAAANVAKALQAQERDPRLCFVLEGPNDFGLALLGAKGLESALEAIQTQGPALVIVLENDLGRRDSDLGAALLDAAEAVVAIESLENDLVMRADVVLPAATFPEGDGTFVNNEGRAQRFYQVYVPEGEIQEAWRWLAALRFEDKGRSGAEWKDLAEVTGQLVADHPVFEPVGQIDPGPGFRVAGQKIPRQAHRYSGRTAMHAHKHVDEPKPPEDPDSALAFSMEGFRGMPPPALLSRVWAPGWNSVQALNKFQSEVAGPLVGGDPGARLISPQAGEGSPYFEEIPEAFKRQEGELLLVPVHHIFGSEELSSLSPGISELSPEAYLALNPADAKALSVGEGELLMIHRADAQLEFPVRLMESLPEGLIAYPYGLSGTVGLLQPGWTTVEKG
jgi:NADH-quinone oxidoreductase subunit G